VEISAGVCRPETLPGAELRLAAHDASRHSHLNSANTAAMGAAGQLKRPKKAPLNGCKCHRSSRRASKVRRCCEHVRSKKARALRRPLITHETLHVRKLGIWHLTSQARQNLSHTTSTRGSYIPAFLARGLIFFALPSLCFSTSTPQASFLFTTIHFFFLGAGHSF
jgi:hypothetical protein